MCYISSIMKEKEWMFISVAKFMHAMGSKSLMWFYFTNLMWAELEKLQKYSKLLVFDML